MSTTTIQSHYNIFEVTVFIFTITNNL